MIIRLPSWLKVKKKSETTADKLIKELKNPDRFWTFNSYYAVCRDINFAIWKANGTGFYHLSYWHEGNTQKICGFNWIDQMRIDKALKIATANSVAKTVWAQDTSRKIGEIEKEKFEKEMGYR